MKLVLVTNLQYVMFQSGQRCNVNALLFEESEALFSTDLVRRVRGFGMQAEVSIFDWTFPKGEFDLQFGEEKDGNITNMDSGRAIFKTNLITFAGQKFSVITEDSSRGLAVRRWDDAQNSTYPQVWLALVESTYSFMSEGLNSPVTIYAPHAQAKRAALDLAQRHF